MADLFSSGGIIVNAASGVLLTALGLAVAMLKPRTRACLALAVFSAAIGLTFVVGNLFGGTRTLDPEQLPRILLSAALRLAAAVSVAYLGLVFPVPLARRERRLVVPAAALGAFVALYHQFIDIGVPILALIQVHRLLLGAWWATLLLLALRFRGSPQRRQSQFALMSLALLIYPGIYAGELSIGTQGATVAQVGVLVTAGTLSAIWVTNTRIPGPAGAARGLAIASLSLPLVGVLAALAMGGYVTADTSGLPGIARTLSVGILAYAILRHQILDIDVKVKWTIKQSTVAAAFIGVFFVVSESASQFFATSGLGPYLGIAAAGALVVALAPLQRAAERVASAAVPGAKAVGEMSRDERAAAYREAARAAWRDGNLSREERDVLEALRAQLGLSHEDSQRLEREVSRA